jgi:hypothetical protein
MKRLAKLSLILAVALSFEAFVWPQDVAWGQTPAGAGDNATDASSVPTAPEPLAPGSSWRVTRYATGFYGDHTLEATTVAEQAFTRYTLYKIRLQFASGAEQSIAITGPPGGLQPEIHDMSGDSVPNDVVLTSKLLHWPLVVLLNDGHDHLTVAISCDSLASDENQAFGSHQVHRLSALLSSGFKTGGLANGGGLLLPRLQENLLRPIAHVVTKYLGYTSTSGRAPPPLVTKFQRAS